MANKDSVQDSFYHFCTIIHRVDIIQSTFMSFSVVYDFFASFGAVSDYCFPQIPFGCDLGIGAYCAWNCIMYIHINENVTYKLSIVQQNNRYRHGSCASYTRFPMIRGNNRYFACVAMVTWFKSWRVFFDQIFPPSYVAKWKSWYCRECRAGFNRFHNKDFSCQIEYKRKVLIKSLDKNDIGSTNCLQLPTDTLLYAQGTYFHEFTSDDSHKIDAIHHVHPMN